jgi:hypothetical protein
LIRSLINIMAKKAAKKTTKKPAPKGKKGKK